MEFMKQQYSYFLEHDITYVSENMTVYFKDGKIKKDTDRHPTVDEFDKGISTYFNPYYNSSYIPTGEKYNLIGYDIDTKDHGKTIKKWFDMVFEENININTFTVFTINGGHHFYFRLTDEQKDVLKNFKSAIGTVYPEHGIDIKYNRGFCLVLLWLI